MKLFGGTVAAWPIGTSAQQPTPLVVGFLHSGQNHNQQLIGFKWDSTKPDSWMSNILISIVLGHY